MRGSYSPGAHGWAGQVRAALHDRINDLHHNRAIGPDSQFAARLAKLKYDLYQFGFTSAAALMNEAMGVSAAGWSFEEKVAAFKRIWGVSRMN